MARQVRPKTMIPEEKVREVAERVSIVDVISEYVQLKRSGSNFLGLCPFHGEKTPSFNVNPARDAFHCFGCGAGGNVFSFVMKMEGVGFPEAVKLLAARAGVVIEERQLTTAEKHAQDERQQFQRINELTAGFYTGLLQRDRSAEPARNYLERRTVGADISEAYRLGFAPDRSDGLVQHLRSAGADLECALKLGIVRKSERGWYDLFRNRLIFPIRDPRGQVIGFAGRVLDASLPKYINSPESPLYHKSSVLFGLDMALPSIRTANAVIIVEGYFDHLALYRAGIRNVVATCGTALTASHAALIKRHAERVYTLFDGDSAGKKATIRSMELFLEQRIPAYVITLPNGDDPDSFLAANPVEAFEQRLKKARPVFEYFVRTLLAEHPPENVDSKVRVVDELAASFRKIADPVERDLYEKEICRLLGIAVHDFRKRMGGIGQTRPDTTSGQKPKARQGDASQETLLALMAVYPDARAAIRQTGFDVVFDEDHLNLARQIDAALERSDDPQNLSRLADTIEDPAAQTMLSKLLVADGHLVDIDWRMVIDQCQRSREKRALTSMRSIALRLGSLDPDSEEYAALLKEAEQLRTRKSKL